MNFNAPWTDLGRVESRVSTVERQLNDKSNYLDVSQLRTDLQSIRFAMDSMERAIGEIRSTCDGLGSRIEALESEVISNNDNA